MKKKVIIISGGMDSVTLLHWAVKEYGVSALSALSFDYGSKHNSKELPLASKQCQRLDVSHIVIKLNFDRFESNLLTTGGDIPEGHYEEENMKQTVVPFRNGILLSYAAGYAESMGADEVMLGSHAGDRAIYPDCREEFTQAMNLAVTLGTYNRVKIVSPFNTWTKGEIVKWGSESGVPYEDTWSCYKGKDEHCGRCGTCVERTESFFENNLRDPVYKTEQEWKEAVKYMKEVCNRG